MDFQPTLATRTGWFKDPLVKGKERSRFRDKSVRHKSVMNGSFEKGVIPPHIRPDKRSVELHPYSIWSMDIAL